MRETRPRKSAGGHQELPSDLQNEIENEIDDELINESINETSGAPNPLRNSLGSKRHATTLGPGDHFGEVEILKQVSETRHENRELISDIWGKRGATYGEKGSLVPTCTSLTLSTRNCSFWARSTSRASRTAPSNLLVKWGGRTTAAIHGESWDGASGQNGECRLASPTLGRKLGKTMACDTCEKMGCGTWGKDWGSHVVSLETYIR